MLEAMVGTIGRETLEATMWDKLESTPFGHFSDANGDLTATTMSEMSAKLATSHIPLDHYNILQGKEAMMAELPKGKNIVPKDGHRMNRADFGDLINHRFVFIA